MSSVINSPKYMYRPRFNIKYTNIISLHEMHFSAFASQLVFKMHFAAVDFSISAQHALCYIWSLK